MLQDLSKYISEMNVLQLLKDLFFLRYLPDLNNNTSYNLLLLFGFLTSFHCIGMCGGIAISQSLRNPEITDKDIGQRSTWFMPSLLYNFGRVLSYTVVGGIAGGLGHIVSFQGAWKGIVPIVGGVFMVIMGVNLLGVFPFLRRFNIRMPYFFAKKIKGQNNYSPMYVGLLSGFMPCGPLQIIQLYALGTRSIALGALSMFLFALGTVPALFIFGAANTFINKKHSMMLTKASAVLVVLLGIVMVGRGFALSGMPLYAANIPSTASKNIAVVQDNMQTITTRLEANAYAPITVQKGIPVKWIIKAEESTLNECNNAIVIPKLKIEKDLSKGDNLIEFIPMQTGQFTYTCWMGMIKSTITVIENLKTPVQGHIEKTTTPAAQNNIKNPPPEVPIKQCMMGNGGQIEDNKICSSTPATLNEKKQITTKEISQTKAAASSKNSTQNSSQAKIPEKTMPIKTPNTPASESQNSKTSSPTPSLEQEFSGVLIDKHCFPLINPPSKDTKFCLQMSSCEASGYGIAVKQSDSTYKFYLFDKKGHALAKDILSNTTKDSDITIKVKGSLNGSDIIVSSIVEEK